jgi:hypothetical protein
MSNRILTIVSGFSESYRPLAELVSKNHAKRAEALGAQYHLEHLPEGERAWPKLPAIIKHLMEGSDVFWIDIDAVFCEQPWGAHLPGDWEGAKDLNMWTDINGPCAGVMYIKNTPETLRFFTACYRNRPHFEGRAWSDQAAIRELMLHRPYSGIVEIVGNLPLPYDEYPDLPPEVWRGLEYRPNWDALFHCPGLPLERRIELLQPFCD